MKSAIVAALLLAGCAGIGGDLKDAADAAKSAGAVCLRVVRPWGNAVATVVNVDKGVVRGGSITVDGDCKFNFNNKEQ